MPALGKKTRWKTVGCSVRGAAHVRTGLPNQDNWKAWLDEDSGATSSILAVSDGHGSHRHFRSHLGSEMAVHTAILILREFAKQASGTAAASDAATLEQAATKDLPKRLVQEWHAAVSAHFQQNPFTEDELKTLVEADGPDAKEQVSANPQLAYGATLLVVAATQNWILYLQLGDGDILTVDDAGETTRPLPEDSRLVANQTTSLCQPEAWNDFRARLVKDADGTPALMLLSTDGYSNSFRSEEDFLLIGRDYLQMIREDGLGAMSQELPAILEEASKKGSGDDITLGIMRRQAGASSDTRKPQAVTNSAFTRLQEDHAAQAAKLRAVEAEYQRTQKSARKFKRTLGVIAAVVLVGMGAFFARNWKPKPPVPIVDPGPKDGTTASHQPEWTLLLDSGANLPLTAEKKITSEDLGMDEKKRPIAQVSKDGRQLTNLSKHAWSVLSESGSSNIEPNKALPLKDKIHIDFHGAAATVLELPPSKIEHTTDLSEPSKPVTGIRPSGKAQGRIRRTDAKGAVPA